jgi:hypothetical protein
MIKKFIQVFDRLVSQAQLTKGKPLTVLKKLRIVFKVLLGPKEYYAGRAYLRHKKKIINYALFPIIRVIQSFIGSKKHPRKYLRNIRVILKFLIFPFHYHGAIEDLKHFKNLCKIYFQFGHWDKEKINRIFEAFKIRVFKPLIRTIIHWFL